jgi:hypothetical protein
VGDYPVRQLILHPRILVGWFSCELDPEVLGSFWLKASATWGGGGSFWLKASVMGRRAVPLFSLCPGIRLTTEEKRGKPQSGQPSSPGTARCADLDVFWGTASAGLLDVRSPRSPRRLQSALGRHRCLPSCRTKGFPASSNFESKLSVNALMWSAKTMSSVRRRMVYIGLVGGLGRLLSNQSHRMRRGDGTMSRSVRKRPLQCSREEV